MTTNELNTRLAKSMGAEWTSVSTNSVFPSVLAWRQNPDHGDPECREISYKDPAIFAELIIWLTKAGYDFFEDDGQFFNKGMPGLHDEDPYKAAALAYIKAKDQQ